LISRPTNRLVIRAEAILDIQEAAQWYGEQERGLGRKFLSAFRAATALLRQNPNLYQVVEGEVRRLLLRRFPRMELFMTSGEWLSAVVPAPHI
jgi:hypothetical protein